jgi:hypothetical protein
MFDKEDIEFIVSAMYKDELRNISEKIKSRESNLAEVVKLNSNLKRYLGKISLIWQKITSVFIKSNMVDGEALSKVVDSLYEREIQYKFELRELNIKKSEIESSYQYIMENITKGDLKYVENLIFMRSIHVDSRSISNQSRTLQLLTE